MLQKQPGAAPLAVEIQNHFAKRSAKLVRAGVQRSKQRPVGMNRLGEFCGNFPLYFRSGRAQLNIDLKKEIAKRLSLKNWLFTGTGHVIYPFEGAKATRLSDTILLPSWTASTGYCCALARRVSSAMREASALSGVELFR
jgi:hypothetical protein